MTVTKASPPIAVTTGQNPCVFWIAMRTVYQTSPFSLNTSRFLLVQFLFVSNRYHRNFVTHPHDKHLPLAELIAGMVIVGCVLGMFFLLSREPEEKTGILPHIETISPLSVRNGETITIHGSSFSKNRNVIKIGEGVRSNESSPDGTSITFTVSRQMRTNCQWKYPTGPVCFDFLFLEKGTYAVSVTTIDGESNTENILFVD
jgi:hypothetical protein